jgi:hypothetical protein
MPTENIKINSKSKINFNIEAKFRKKIRREVKSVLVS